MLIYSNDIIDTTTDMSCDRGISKRSNDDTTLNIVQGDEQNIEN